MEVILTNISKYKNKRNVKMRKKSILGILFIFSLSFSAMITSVLGQMSYTCEVKVGDQFIVEVVELNPGYGNNNGMNLGDTTKYKITNVTEGTDSFFIEFETTSNISIPKHPTTAVTMQNPLLNFVVLCPVDSYLQQWASTRPDLTRIADRTLHYDGGRVWTFSSNGVISEFKYSNSTDLLYVLRTQSSSTIPGTDLPILIGITILTVLSLVYVWRKRKQV
jgi:hypothetical protein